MATALQVQKQDPKHSISQSHQEAIESMAGEMFEEDFGYTASMAPSGVMREYVNMASEYFFESMGS